MTIYTNEALRRLNSPEPLFYQVHHAATKVLAEALQELGWKPPVDPLLLRAREIVAEIYEGREWDGSAKHVRQGDFDGHVTMIATLAALKENSNA